MVEPYHERPPAAQPAFTGHGGDFTRSSMSSDASGRCVALPPAYRRPPAGSPRRIDGDRRRLHASRREVAIMTIKNPPKGYHSVTPALSLKNAAQAIDFYRKAFGAEEQSRFAGPDGRIMHAEIRIGDSLIMLGEQMPEMGATVTTSSLWIYTDDADGLYKRAVTAGAKALMAPSDAFW